MFLRVLKTPLQFIFCTSLSNKHSYHLWLLAITKSGKKSNKFDRLQIEVFFLPNISHPPFPRMYVRIYAHDVLTGFYGI